MPNSERDRFANDNISKAYITAVRDEQLALGFSIALVPAKSFRDGTVPSLSRLIGALGGDQLATFESPAVLPFLLAVMSQTSDSESLATRSREILDMPISALLRAYPQRLIRFTEYVSFADLLAIEESPLRKIALAGVHALAAGVMGAAAGITIAMAFTPAGPIVIVSGVAGAALCMADNDQARGDVTRAVHSIMERAGLRRRSSRGAAATRSKTGKSQKAHSNVGKRTEAADIASQRERTKAKQAKLKELAANRALKKPI